MNDRKKSTRGSEAKRLIDNRVLNEAFNEVDQHIHQEWANTPFEAKEIREMLYFQQKNLQSVKKMLESYVNVGKLADFKLGNDK